jgi:hypothetical protein
MRAGSASIHRTALQRAHRERVPLIPTSGLAA